MGSGHTAWAGAGLPWSRRSPLEPRGGGGSSLQNGNRRLSPFCSNASPGVWGLVNNAGISTFGEVEFTSMDTYKEVAEVNLWGTIRTTKAFLPLIRRAKGKLRVAVLWGSRARRAPQGQGSVPTGHCCAPRGGESGGVGGWEGEEQPHCRGGLPGACVAAGPSAALYRRGVGPVGGGGGRGGGSSQCFCCPMPPPPSVPALPLAAAAACCSSPGEC